MKTREQALVWLAETVEAESDPPLSVPEMSAILDAHIVSVEYQPYTAFSFGDRVQPGNGRMYRAIQSGTTAASITWPTIYTQKYGDRIGDGTVVWQDDGPQFGEMWDLPGAAKACWLRKAAKAAERFNAQDRDTNLQEQQVYDHCRNMAALYESSWVP